MNNDKVIACVLQVYTDCNVKSFPIDCFGLLKHYGYRIYTYEKIKKLNSELFFMCTQYSDDAFRDGNSMTIAYNEHKSRNRIRFSLMHELGHHILNHKRDCFENVADVCDIFSLSPKASQYAFNDYRKWLRLSTYKLRLLDKKMYLHFYNPNTNGFVWKISSCEFCGKELYNSPLNRCSFCELPDIPYYQKESYRDDNDLILSRLHQKWLDVNCF